MLEGDRRRVIADGDDRREAFRSWYRAEIPRLFNFVSYWILDRATAEDLTAAICEQALCRLDQYDARRGSFDAWMFGIARNWLRSYFRARRRRPEIVSLDALPDVAYTGPAPETMVEEAEVFRLLLRHLDQLSVQEREALSLRYGAGLSNKEAAGVMGVSANQVGVLLHRARKKLREVVQRSEVE